MIDGASLRHLLRVVKKPAKKYGKYVISIKFFSNLNKKSVSKTSLAFFSKHGFQSGKLE